MNGTPRQLAHRRGLDGIRGLAIAAVLLYHGGDYPGGFLGVEIFFVLSGYLITSLLVAERSGTGRISLSRFWARRARRLLPALFCLVAVVSIQQALVGPIEAVPDFRADAISTLFYFANWHQLFAGSGYFVVTAITSPLQHTWSLAIEEQFYVVWPLLVLGVWVALGRGRGKRGGVPLPLLALTACGAVASAIEMKILYNSGFGIDRAYYGTDTRAQGLLFGATLAVALALGREGRRGFRWLAGPDAGTWSDAAAGTAGDSAGRGRRRLLAWLPPLAGAAGIAGLALALAQARGSAGWLYGGGFAGVDAASVLVIWSVACTGGPRLAPVRWILESWPLRATGVISYGLYLWHYPLFLWLDNGTTGLSGAALLSLRVGATYVVAVVSYFAVERQIRAQQLPRPLVRALAPVGLAGALVAAVVASGVASAVTLPTRLPPVVGGWAGTSPACRVPMPGTPSSGTLEYHTCPPVRVLLVGDSVAFSLGVQLAYREQDYGIVLDNAAILGCSFSTRGLVSSVGEFVEQYPPCSVEDMTWVQDVKQFKPQVVLVEMGWWDAADRLWGRTDEHLGDPTYDAFVERRIVTLDRDLSGAGAKVVLLSVPWMSPPALPDGDASPDASPVRHAQIDALLAQAAAAAPAYVQLFDLDPIVAPAGHFTLDVGGSVCRVSDGVHFYIGSGVVQGFQPTWCGAEVQAALFPMVRRLAATTAAAMPAGP